MLSKPKTVWMAGVNLGGIWSRNPIKGYLNEDFNRWWDRSGNFGVEKLGTDKRYGIITFASTSKEEVKVWLSGLSSAFSMIKRYTR